MNPGAGVDPHGPRVAPAHDTARDTAALPRSDPATADAGMADLVFAVRGVELPADYRHALWTALCGAAPWLRDAPHVGVQGVHSVPTGAATVLLGHRARLTLRLPAARLAQAAAALEGRRIDIAGAPLEIGASHVRALAAAATLYAEFVSTGSAHELAFRDEVATALQQLGVAAGLVCGGARALAADGCMVRGFALALYGLAPDGALKLLCEGLGRHRELGCGFFVPHKTIVSVG